MIVFEEVALKDFKFWSGGAQFRAHLTDDEMDRLESMMSDIYPDGVSQTAINDMFWFGRDFIADLLGTTEDEIWERD